MLALGLPVPAAVGLGTAARSRKNRRASQRCSAQSHQPSGADSAREVLHTCLGHFQRKQLQDIMPYLPSSEVARGSMLRLSKHQGSNPVLFEQVIEGMLLQNPAEHFLDSYALRNLVVSPPATCQELSAVMVGESMWVCRQAVQAATGEEAVLTFSLSRNTPPSGGGGQHADIGGPPLGRMPRSDTSVSSALPPAGIHGYDVAGITSQEASTSAGEAASSTTNSQQDDDDALYVDPAPMGIGAPVAAATGISSITGGAARQASTKSKVTPVMPPPWRLSRVRGEPRHVQLPGVPSPEFSPESVVQAQLTALQQYDFSQAYALLSPAAQGLVGPLDRYITSMGRSRLYRSLVAHRSATSLRRCQHSSGTYLEVVAVQGLGGRDERTHRLQPSPVSLYCWIVTKQEEPGPLKDCWLTEWVKLVDDPKLRHVLGLSLPQREQEE